MPLGIKVEKTDGLNATVFVGHIVSVCEMNSYAKGEFTRIFVSSGNETYIDTYEPYEEFMVRLQNL